MSQSKSNQSNGTLLDACKEARHTMDQQIDKIHREDQKAVKIFRVNLLFLSIAASGVALAVQAKEITAAQFGNAHLLIGSVLIFLSTLTAAMAYTSSNFRMGVKPTVIEDAQSMTRYEYLDKLSDEYSIWVKENHKVHRINAHTINAALILALASLLFFGGGFGVGVTSAKGALSSYVALGLEVIIALIVGGLVYWSNDIFGFLASEQ